ncbi:hypothetical protein PACTADRAFT_50432 [Pachysolen tannophilus NRRL Y-2460]|uniref:Amino acid permease/ SLC12A domain-containing protein n=1 Tax=Pachysolen tannophilus NRRL Y-2460 TaxID=669874 RepID=A0A1E4TS11_PACTA|nr:hypothetical protein PACTADRAFT_50432 [Pachysolen tannophilus NRRL Y-2460]
MGVAGVKSWLSSSKTNTSVGDLADIQTIEERDISYDDSSNKEEGNVDEIKLDHGERRIGYISAVFLVTNRIVGTGIFSTSSTIFTLSGSVGTSLILWFVGALIAMAGLFVYASFGSYPIRQLQRNGGEKNYLEFIYKKPKFMVTCMYAVYILLLGWAAGNSVVFGEYILLAAGKDDTEWASRGIGIACVSFAFLVHGVNVTAGMYLQNLLGVFKVAVIIVISVTGWVALGGGLKTGTYEPTHNFSDAFSGSKPTGYGIVTALYNVIWSYIGYSNVNYSLSEVKDPVRALKYSAPAALVVISIIYMFVNIAYFAVIPKDVISSSGQIIAADFFKIAFGTKAQKAISVFVALSALGNVMSVIFSQGRIVQQLGREGVLPFSKLFATQRPFNSPFVGLFEHWLICVITIVAPPAGDAYNFVLNLISYPLNIINFFVAIGLLWLHFRAHRGEIEWKPPIRSPIIVTFFFALASLYLVIAPYIPPDDGQSVYTSMPYWTHCVAAWGVFFVGFVYWVIWALVLPKLGHYKLVNKEILDSDGFWKNKFFKVPNDVVDIDDYVNKKYNVTGDGVEYTETAAPII